MAKQYYQSAKTLMRLLKQEKITSRALLESYIEQVEAFNPAINAVVATDFERARSQADAADRARQDGHIWGPLHGLPMTIKDTFEVVGMPCTAGSPHLKEHMPKQNAVAVDCLQRAGAIIYGKTNVPLFASDIQSFNKIYGTTNNPRNLSLTPGGSSGGAAAALTAGFTSVELGSDIGGSIRTPAHFCGVFGHKSTASIISQRGHIPGPPGMLSESDMSVVGPMARTADDLQLLLDVVAGEQPLMNPGWRLSLPACKPRKLSDFKVLLWLDDPLCEIDSTLIPAYETLVKVLSEQGVQVDRGSPQGMQLEDFYPTYLNLLGSVVGAAHSKAERMGMPLLVPAYRQAAKWFNLPRHFDQYFAGASQSHFEWLRANEKRHKLRAKFSRVFEQYDVVLSPVALVHAFEHLQSGEVPFRTLLVNGRKRHYTDLFMWVAPATLMGLPATSAPIGKTQSGLPVNVQIIGGPYQDKTTIKFASLLEKLLGGFSVPPGYE